MQVNKKAYAETLDQFNIRWASISFDESTGKITTSKMLEKSSTHLMTGLGYDSIEELESDLNETYTALCQPRYNIVISLNTMDEVNAYLAKIGTKGVKVLKDEVEIDLNELKEE